MKKNFLFRLTIITALFLVVSSSGKSDPIDYNDEILGYYTELDDQIAVFEAALWNPDYTMKELEYEYDKVYRIYYANYDALKEIKPLRKDPGFLESVINFYDGIKEGLDNEYKQIMNMLNADKWLDSYNDKIIDLDDQVLDKLIDLENKVIDKQEELAEIYEFDLY